MITKELNAIFDKYYSDKDQSIEKVLQELRKAGASQLICTRVLVLKLKLSLSEADKIVVNSKAWNDKFDSVKELRGAFFDLNNEEVKDK